MIFAFFRDWLFLSFWSRSWSDFGANLERFWSHIGILGRGVGGIWASKITKNHCNLQYFRDFGGFDFGGRFKMVLGALLEALGGLLGRSWGVWRGVLESFWGYLGGLGAILGRLGAIFGCLRAVLALSWGVLWLSLAVLGCPGAILGRLAVS